MRQYPLSIFLVIAIWVVCMIPVPETPLNSIAFIDKWTHFVMYGTLTLVIWSEYFYHTIRLRRKTRAQQGNATNLPPMRMFTPKMIVIGIILPTIMGGLVELAQAYLTTCRSGDVFDFICNTLGVLLGTALASILYVIVRNKQ